LQPYVPRDLAFAQESFSPRALLMLGLIALWMCRLSYNTWRRGLFTLNEEDYRWAVLRQTVSPFLFQVINFVFISAIQNILLLFLSLPVYTASVLQPHTPLALSDYVLAIVALIILLLEFTADNQQFAFHAYKHAYLAQKKTVSVTKKYESNAQWLGARLNWQPEDAERGFCTRGLWAASRHPNFACEQAFWIIITAFPLYAPDPPYLVLHNLDLWALLEPTRAAAIPILIKNLTASLWHILPAASLCLLFWASTCFTESITASKYPAYKAYQKRVGMFHPAHTVLWKRAWILLFGGGQRELAVLDKLVWKKVD